MANAMSITSKYQVTVPKEVRDALGISSSDSLTFHVEKGRAYIEKVPTLAEIQARVQRHIQAHNIGPVSDAEMKRAREIFDEKKLTWE